MPRILAGLRGLTFLMASCEPSGTILLDDDDVTGDDDDDVEIPEVEIGDWQACALIPGQDDSGAECAQARMPLDTGCIDDTLPVQFDGYPEYNH